MGERVGSHVGSSVRGLDHHNKRGASLSIVRRNLGSLGAVGLCLLTALLGATIANEADDTANNSNEDGEGDHGDETNDSPVDPAELGHEGMVDRGTARSVNAAFVSLDTVM